MTALAADRNTPTRENTFYRDPVAAATTIYAGALVCLDASGNLVPGSVSTTLIARGRADENVDNSAGAAGDLSCTSRKGVFKFANDGTIDRANIGDTAYIVDDQTVADNNGSSTRSAAGTIVDVESDGVWINIV